MDGVTLSKRNLIALVSSSAILTLVIGWFVGIYFFDGSSLNQSLRSKSDTKWLNTMVGEYSQSSLQEELLEESKTRLGGEASTVTYTGVDGGDVYTNSRNKLTFSLPARVRLTTDIVGNAGIPLVVHEVSAAEVVVGEAARMLAPRELVGSADRSILPTFIETDPAYLAANGMHIELTSVATANLQTVLAKQFPNCQVQGVTRKAIEGSKLEQVDVAYIAGENCSLTFQPFIRYSPLKEILVVANADTGCRFFSPAKKDPVIEECLDTKILESLAFSD